MSHYPPQFPTEEAQHLYQMASTGSLRDNIAHAFHDAWWVGGFLAKFAVGEPDNHGQFGAEEFAATVTEEQWNDLAKLSCLAGITVDDLTLPGEAPGALLDNIDIAKLMVAIQTVVTFLKALGIIP